MENINNFINSIAAGDNVTAKEELEELLSSKAFDALQVANKILHPHYLVVNKKNTQTRKLNPKNESIRRIQTYC